MYLILILFLLEFIICGSEILSNGLTVAPQDGHYEEEVATKLYEIYKQQHESKIKQYYKKRQYWVTTNVGHSMFKNDLNTHFKSQNKIFIIFVWKNWSQWFKSRHLSNHVNNDPLYECSVKNCIVMNDMNVLPLADAVLVHVGKGIIPNWPRRPFQRWVFLSDESPKNLFKGVTVKQKLSNWANIFNWTMTYRSDSDVPIPYGRTLPLSAAKSVCNISESIADYIPNWKSKKRDVLLVVLMSSCYVTKRMNYIKNLQKYITVDMYGKCSRYNKNRCPGRYHKDCPILKKYLFYLAFENSGCRQYITEKTFHNSFSNGAIPIIMGPPVEDCKKLLPPHSFLHVDHFKNSEALSKFVKRLNMNEDKLLMYHQWRRLFKVSNEHGYSGTKSYAVCRLCEALNYNNNRPNVYDLASLKLFFDTELLCKY